MEVAGVRDKQKQMRKVQGGSTMKHPSKCGENNKG
jgi:hypothetical protein